MADTERHIPTPEMKEEAISLLIRGWSQRRIAKKVGVSHTAVYLWAKDPDVKARIAEARTSNLETAGQIYSAQVAKLVRTELDIALGKKDATPQQVKALDQALKRAGLAVPVSLPLSAPKDSLGPLGGEEAIELLKALPPALLIRALRALGVDFTALPPEETP